MHYKIQIDKKPLKFLKELEKTERDKVLEEIHSLSENPRKHGVIKLKDSDPSEYRTRQGNYRIIFEIQDQVLIIRVIRIFVRGDEY